MFKNLILVAALFSAASAFAQSNDGGYCASIPMEKQIAARTDISEEEKTKLLAEHEQMEAIVKRRTMEIYAERNNKDEITYVIPVVFHIFHKNGPENISEAQIRDCLRLMNEEFNAKNSKLSEVIPEFKSIVGNTNIEFKLATRDPQGACTNGINRIYNPNTYYNTRQPIEALKPAYGWPTNKYLNCFIVGSIQSSGGGRTLGYAQFPGGNATSDGLVMVHDGIGAIGTSSASTASVATHEVGHWLGLRHAWGDCAAAGDIAACGCDDGISDTPNTKGSPSVCDLKEASCGPLANVQNFMDYSFCYAMFTQEQSAKMRSIMETVASRKNLWQPANITATGTEYPTGVQPNPLCKADFIPSTYNELCGGDDVKFTDYSYGSVSSWSWEFEGGNPATSNIQNPTIAYTSPGTYKVKLTVSDGVNSVTTTKESIVKVIPSNALGAPYIQRFASLSALAPDYSVKNDNNDATWVLKTGVGYNDTKCAYIQSRTITGAGKIDELISNTIDVSGLSEPVLRFKYAHSRKTSANTDELDVFLSTDCGNTWSKRKTLKGTSLQTGPADVPTGDFAPASASEWKSAEISLANYKVAGLRFKLQYIANGGNNVYVDDIMIGEPTVGVNELAANTYELSLFPNPAKDNTTISFELTTASSAKVEVFDVVGKSVSTVHSGNLNAGDHQFDVSRNNMTPGIYFVKLTINNQQITKKLIFN